MEESALPSSNNHRRIPVSKLDRKKRERRLKRRNRVFNSLFFQLSATSRKREKSVHELGAAIILGKKIETLAIPFPLSGYPLPPSLPSSKLDEARLIRGSNERGRRKWTISERGWIRSRHVS